MPTYIEQRLNELTHLPRPIYGQTEALPNKLIGFSHSHPWVQFSYAISGVLEVQTAQGRFIAPPQRAVWVPAGVKHQVQCSAQTQIRSLYIDHQVITNPPSSCRVVEVSPLLKELIRAFGELPVEYDENSAEGRLAAVLLDQLTYAPDMGFMLPLPKDKRLQRIVSQLQKHPDATDSLSLWAQRLHVSEKTLSRLFAQQTGLTFRLWRQRLRLLHALPLLEQKQSVTEVALACGYESISAFIAAFGEHFGSTPSEFFKTLQF
ncbi:helix-turn-helix transcriptional regulator [Denitrificimonas sp. JX-1]|uniref:Helix-turn-helix transcriptional regulator n=2 Tax=Denitrificimonas halotolerans TaxID=3098930 RepID=A0ABU5GSA5_9GAMM|nr:helix-turn-helix transcriptional regulator [Denitrificimonas sp. JX-1]MDY7219858.1 helix-turn-helix transcriptional regulator [Denitrificimonas sp. JX-1]